MGTCGTAVGSTTYRKASARLLPRAAEGLHLSRVLSVWLLSSRDCVRLQRVGACVQPVTWRPQRPWFIPLPRSILGALPLLRDGRGRWPLNGLDRVAVRFVRFALWLGVVPGQ